VVWAAMLYTLFAQIGAVRFAFPADRVVAMRVPAGTAQDVAVRVAAIPAVTRTAISSGMLGGGERVRIQTGGGVETVASRVPVGDGFLETLGVPLLRGRGFNRSELHGDVGVAILSESGARQLAPDGNAMGLRLRAPNGRSLVVIGVCRDTIDYGALSKAGTFAPAQLYVPYEPLVASMNVVVLARMSVDPHPALRAIAAAAGTPAGARPVRPVVLSDDITQHGADGSLIVA